MEEIKKKCKQSTNENAPKLYQVQEYGIFSEKMNLFKDTEDLWEALKMERGENEEDELLQLKSLSNKEGHLEHTPFALGQMEVNVVTNLRTEPALGKRRWMMGSIRLRWKDGNIEKQKIYLRNLKLAAEQLETKKENKGWYREVRYGKEEKKGVELQFNEPSTWEAMEHGGRIKYMLMKNSARISQLAYQPMEARFGGSLGGAGVDKKYMPYEINISIAKSNCRIKEQGKLTDIIHKCMPALEGARTEPWKYSGVREKANGEIVRENVFSTKILGKLAEKILEKGIISIDPEDMESNIIIFEKYGEERVRKCNYCGEYGHHDTTEEGIMVCENQGYCKHCGKETTKNTNEEHEKECEEKENLKCGKCGGPHMITDEMWCKRALREYKLVIKRKMGHNKLSNTKLVEHITRELEKKGIDAIKVMEHRRELIDSMEDRDRYIQWMKKAGEIIGRTGKKIISKRIG